MSVKTLTLVTRTLTLITVTKQPCNASKNLLIRRGGCYEEPLSENEKSDMNCVLKAGENVDEKLEKEDIQPCKVCGKDCKTVKQLNDHNLQEHGGTQMTKLRKKSKGYK